MGTQQEAIGRLDGKIESIQSTLASINKKLDGNGQPGVLERMTRIEENLEFLTTNQRETAELVQSIAQSVGELKDSVQNHHNDKDLHTFKGLFLKRDVISLTILVFLILHSLLPENVDLWVVLSKFFGM